MGLRKHTKLKYELLIHDNGSTDGTSDWLKTQAGDITITRSEKNEGFCGVNHVLKLARYPHVMIMNVDMYPLPFWDTEILKQINKFKARGVDKYTISSCLVEGLGNNPEYTIFYAGHSPETFNEKRLLEAFLKESKKDKLLWKKPDTIQWSHPILIPKFMMEEVGYLDTSYFPGWNIDNDLPRSLHEKGCDKFIMLGSSRVYHFVSATFKKLPVEIRSKHGQDIFLKKWVETTDDFREKMKIGQIIDETVQR